MERKRERERERESVHIQANEQSETESICLINNTIAQFVTCNPPHKRYLTEKKKELYVRSSQK